jgi:hypothetical protein
VFLCFRVSVSSWDVADILRAMRGYVATTLVCVMAIAAAAQDHLATLGISEGRAKEAVFDSFMSDAVSIAGKPAAFTALSPESRSSTSR